MMDVYSNKIFDKCFCTIPIIFMCMCLYHWPCWISYIVTSFIDNTYYYVNNGALIISITMLHTYEEFNVSFSIWTATVFLSEYMMRI